MADSVCTRTSAQSPDIFDRWAAEGAAARAAQSTAFNLQDKFTLCAAAGYDRGLALHPQQVQSIAARLRGISAIAAVLMVAGDPEDMQLGDRIHMGLVEAIEALTSDAASVLDRADEHASSQRGAA